MMRQPSVRGRILVIDDNDNQRDALRRILRRSHFDVLDAPNGRVGLRMALEQQPDLILLDIEMPAMSGHEFLRRFRHRQQEDNFRRMRVTPETPVVFLTGRDKLDHRIAGLDSGASDYITKPVDADELRARVRMHLRLVERQRQWLAGIRAEMLKLESTVGQMRDVARACLQLLPQPILSTGPALPDVDDGQAQIAHAQQLLTQIINWPSAPDFWEEEGVL
ncbi:MAG: response regulator transcription factor [Sedimentisphaerales bacterium]|nr:response regulator transcription factor [Sedimentisphaerales bacterium]